MMSRVMKKSFYARLFVQGDARWRLGTLLMLQVVDQCAAACDQRGRLRGARRSELRRSAASTRWQLATACLTTRLLAGCTHTRAYRHWHCSHAACARRAGRLVRACRCGRASAARDGHDEFTLIMSTHRGECSATPLLALLCCTPGETRSSSVASI